MRFVFQQKFHSVWLECVAGAFIIVILLVFSLWYSSAGMFPRFPDIGNAYQEQADAFLHGQVALLVEPSPDLVALENPYDPDARTQVPIIWDLSYYQGRYYLYWGPVPACFFALLSGILGRHAPDSILSTASVIGICAIALILLTKIRKQVFSNAPSFSVGLLLVVLIFHAPALFNLGLGRVYETAITMGQLFLYLGLLGWFIYLENSRPGWLILAGFSWGFAVATRSILLVSVVISLGFALAWIWKEHVAIVPAARRAGYILVPLAICAIGLAAFNWVRFGNPLETGLRYQFSFIVPDNRFFSTTYILPNLYLYFASPIKYDGIFPVITPLVVDPGWVPSWASFPSGKMVAYSFLGLNAIPVLGLLAMLLPLLGVIALKRRTMQVDQPKHVRGWPQFFWMVILSGLAQFIVLLLYYYTATRFMFDFTPALLMTFIFVMWGMDRHMNHRPVLRILLWVVAVFFVVWTAVMAFFGGFSSLPQVLATHNPSLLGKIANGWDSFYNVPGAFGWIFRRVFRFVLTLTM